MLNIAANSAIAIFAGALTIALVQGRRVAVAANSLPHWVVLNKIQEGIASKANPPEDPDLRIALAKAADYIADLTSAIQYECPSAELTFWTRIVTDTMRRLAAAETPFSISEADYIDHFASFFRPTGDAVLDADTQALIAEAKAGASTQPLAPTGEILDLRFDLLHLTVAAYAAAEAQAS